MIPAQMTLKQRLIKLKNRLLKPEWDENLYGWKSWIPLRSREQGALEYDYGDRYTISEDWWKNRPAGISCMLRVKNEAEFIEASLRSVKDFFDEIVIVYNLCTDGTEAAVARAVERWGIRNVREYQYPFAVFSCWKDHGEYNTCTSIHSPAYYTNWCRSLTRYSHVCRWDGDNVALPEMVTEAYKNRVLRCNVIRDRGQDICLDLKHTDVNRTMVLEAHFYRVNYHTRTVQTPYCEVFKHGWKGGIETVDEPTFLHLKMAKKEYRSAARPGKEWTGHVPEWLTVHRDHLLEREKNNRADHGRRRPLEHEAQPELVQTRNAAAGEGTRG